MNFISVLSCLSLLLAAAAAQAPKPCGEDKRLVYKLCMAADGHIMSSGKISYDAFGQRMRVRNFGVVGNETFAMDQIMLTLMYNVYYEIDWSKFSCKKKPLDSSFILMQVPKDAKLMGQVFLGSSSSWGMGVLVNTWGGELPNNATYSAVFTEVGCVPMTLSAYVPSYGWTMIR
uniref:Ependymin-like 1 n=1 Tax=Mola mola TaxID=94237 RepID=A0A3Q3XBZ2_MOLML